MKTSDEDKLVVQFVWGGGFSPDYMQIGSFQLEGSNWPHIFVTVPIEWAEAHRDQWNDLVAQMAVEFVNRYNAGLIHEGDRTYKM